MRLGQDLRAQWCRTIKENAFQAQVVQMARALGWELCYHTLRSEGCEPGYPDLHLLHPAKCRSIFSELKSETGNLTAEQYYWLTSIEASAPPEVYVWKPSDMDEIERVLRR